MCDTSVIIDGIVDQIANEAVKMINDEKNDDLKDFRGVKDSKRGEDCVRTGKEETNL